MVLPCVSTPRVAQRSQQYIEGLAAATNLTSLSLTCPGVFKCIVPELALLQSLQQLELVDACCIESFITEHCEEYLQQLTALTHLKLGFCITYATDYMLMRQSIRCVWGLTQLRSVAIDCNGDTRPWHPESFHGLSSTTQLSSFYLRAPSLCLMSAGQPDGPLEGGYWRPYSKQDALPGLSSLTQLQVLKMQQAKCQNPSFGFVKGLKSSMLSAFSNIEHLPVALHFENLEPPATGAQDVLSLLPQLQQLKALELRIQGLKSCPHTALTALTASSNLRYLSLDGSRLPCGAVWQQVFALQGDSSRLPLW